MAKTKFEVAKNLSMHYVSRMEELEELSSPMPGSVHFWALKAFVSHWGYASAINGHAGTVGSKIQWPLIWNGVSSRFCIAKHAHAMSEDKLLALSS